jgi:hypothetical protein
VLARSLLNRFLMARDRSTDIDCTVKRHVDLSTAFGEELPTSPAVHPLVPLDAIPALAVPRSGLPWNDLGKLATQLLLRVDGTTTVMTVVRVDTATPMEAARELAHLAATGLVRLVSPGPIEMPSADLELDLSVL